MESEKLYTFIQSPLKVNEEDVEDLKVLVNQYPFFQAARFLLALAQPTTEHIREAALSSQDRNLLKKMIDLKINPYKIDSEIEVIAEEEPEDEQETQAEVLRPEAIADNSTTEDSPVLEDESEELLHSDGELSWEDTPPADSNPLQESAESEQIVNFDSEPAEPDLGYFEPDIQVEDPKPQEADDLDFKNDFALDQDLEEDQELEQETLISNFIDGYEGGIKENYSLGRETNIDLAQLDERKIIEQSASAELAKLMLEQRKYEQVLIIYKTLSRRDPDLKNYYDQKIKALAALQESPFDF